MQKFRVKKGNIDRRDAERALLTDTSPSDVPIIFSNDGFHGNLRRNDRSPTISAIVSGLITLNKDRYTIPYRYRIHLSNVSSRQISLTHPAAQFKATTFYQQYGHMIPYFCRHRDVSMRRPTRIGSTYFFLANNSGRKHLKGTAIDLLLDEQTARNPSSFFTYETHDRFYKFFGSDEFVQLEKLFSYMRLMDVSKCFSSIYSHTLAWAVKDVQHGKESTLALSFANEFDDLMQYSNYNETNGIPVGWEVSRLFAEVILQSVDVALLRQTEKRGLVHGRDFVVRRYVDDFVIFTNDLTALDEVQRILSDALQVFNLHLNDTKTTTMQRPLQTRQSQIVAAASIGLNLFREKVSQRDADKRIFRPVNSRNAQAIVTTFINDMKVACINSGANYADISPYIIGSMCRTIEALIESFDLLKRDKSLDRKSYLQSFTALFRAMYYFFTVHVTVTTSYQVAKATILGIRFFTRRLPQFADTFHEVVRSLIEELISNPSLQKVNMSDYVPIEVLNILLASTELPNEYQSNVRSVRARVLDEDRIDYFSIVSLLFYFGASDQAFIDQLERKLQQAFLDAALPRRDAHDAHFLLDLASCPHLSLPFRRKVIRKLLQAANINAQVPLGPLLTEFVENPWFVNWKEIDLLNHLRKKELSPVY